MYRILFFSFQTTQDNQTIDDEKFKNAEITTELENFHFDFIR